MAAPLVTAALMVVCAAAGIIVYRRSIGSRPYSGSMPGALGLASILGVLMGVSIALATLTIVLTMRAAK